MKYVAAPLVAALPLLALTACADSAADTPDGGDATTAALLTGAVNTDNSTPIPLDAGAVQEGPRVEVASLGFNRGDSEAVVKVVELSDFGCGYCRRFHDETFPTLREEFIESGMVEWKFIPYITGMFANSMAATEGSECVMAQGVDQYESIAHRLWQQQSDWKNSNEAEAVVRGWVSELDVDMDQYDACVASDERVPRIASSTTLARQLGVRGTPTFVIIGYGPLQGALPLEVFQEVFTVVYNTEMEQRGGTAPDTTTTEGAEGN